MHLANRDIAAQTDIWAVAVGSSVTLSNRWGSQSGESRAPFIGVGVPVDEVAAGDLRAGDVVRVEDPEAQRVDRVVLVDGRVVVALRPVGLDVADAVRVTLAVDMPLVRLGRAAD